MIFVLAISVSLVDVDPFEPFVACSTLGSTRPLHAPTGLISSPPLQTPLFTGSDQQALAAEKGQGFGPHKHGY